MEANGITQADLSKALEGRSKGYVSDRVLGKRSWAISELDRLAPLFGLPDALSLVAAACGSISSEAARAYEARERESQITDDLIDRIAAPPKTTTWPRTRTRTHVSKPRRLTSEGNDNGFQGQSQDQPGQERPGEYR